MNTGTRPRRKRATWWISTRNPTKLIEIVEIGKQLLITRGALTTFSIANDVAKYFAIIPAMFMATYPELAALNIMRLATPKSAILSAVIFNALIIVALIPLALRGVKYRPVGAAAMLRRNLLIYGVGGMIVPFIGIKAIDLILVALHTGIGERGMLNVVAASLVAVICADAAAGRAVRGRAAGPAPPRVAYGRAGRHCAVYVWPGVVMAHGECDSSCCVLLQDTWRSVIRGAWCTMRSHQGPLVQHAEPINSASGRVSGRAER